MCLKGGQGDRGDRGDRADLAECAGVLWDTGLSGLTGLTRSKGGSSSILLVKIIVITNMGGAPFCDLVLIF